MYKLHHNTEIHITTNNQNQCLHKQIKNAESTEQLLKKRIKLNQYILCILKYPKLM